jgi:hypothetical protein
MFRVKKKKYYLWGGYHTLIEIMCDIITQSYTYCVDIIVIVILFYYFIILCDS